MSDQFVSLHTHTSYSQLDGASKIPELVDRAVELGMPGLGISDHGNLNGIIDFYRECKKKGINPTLGQEFYFSDDRLVKEVVKQENENGEIDGSDKRYYHLSIWAENNEGYQNLLKLSSDAFLKGMYYKPRTDYSMLEDHSDGIFIGTGCLGGPVLQKLLHDDYNGALLVAAHLQDIVGRDNLFVEMMNHDLPEQRKTNPQLLQIAKDLNAPYICTQDSHYTHKHDAKHHDVLLCCQTSSKVSDENRFKFHNDEYYLKSADQMRDLFRDYPDACNNTLWIAERSNVEIDFSTLHLPQFPVPDGFDNVDDFLEHLSMEGLKNRYNGNPSQEHYERLAYELSVIKQLDLSSYFLIFWDLVQFSTREGIFTGPGRGSAAGSLVSYSLGITKVDPVKHGLIFERFINPDRIALADIDWDIDTRYRDVLINYTREKYGDDRVAQIITFGIIKARTAVRDSARVLGYDWALGDKIAKAMPPLIMGVDTPLYACFEHEEKYDSGYRNAQGLREMYHSDSKAKDIIDSALGIEGLVRQDGVHAAAVVIGDQPLTNLVPLQQKKDKPVVTQWSKDIVEDLGLLKMDFLGLRNLDVISDTLKRLNLPFDHLEKIDMEDPKIFDLLRRGEVIGLFQVESAPMRDLLKTLLPDSIDDISAVLALYRPGPMSSNMHYDYADRKNGRKFAIPFHPDAEEILRSTYQLAVYQEQVMQLSRKFAGYSMAEADNLRKIMGKKLPEKMKAERSKFVDGCIAQGYDPDFSDELFEMIEGFSNYGFNFSHSLAYSYITYWTAYLKVYHPLEYMASICTSIMDELEKTAVYLYETRRMGFKVYPPDINLSESIYTVEEDGIRVGLNTLRHMGKDTADAIIKERDENGKFTSVYDFAKRVNPNIQTFKSLAHSGALDSFGTRLGISSVSEDILKSVRKELKKNAKEQTSLFSAEDVVDFNIPKTEFAWSQFLAKEKESLGIYASGHPLEDYESLVEDQTILDMEDFEQSNKLYDVLAMVSTVEVKYTKKGEAMAMVTLEDQTGSLEAVVFPRTWREFKTLFFVGNIIKVSLKVTTDFRDQRGYIVQFGESILSGGDTPDIDTIFGIYLPEKFNSDPKRMSKLKGVLLSHSGQVPVKIYKSRSSVIKLDHEYEVSPSTDLKRDVVGLFKEYISEKGK
jgi:DNA polymerase-3 subunit alpha